MPNLRKPIGLFLKKGVWNKLCVSCKRYMIRNNVIRDVEIFLCFKCKQLFLGKKKKIKNVRPYKIFPICSGCGTRFEAETCGRRYCDKCRPNPKGNQK